MSRDHRRLRVFQDSHRLVIAIYAITMRFPKDEYYCSFINIALGSARELAYLLQLASDLQLLSRDAGALVAEADSVVAQLHRLHQVMDQRAHSTPDLRPKT